MFTEVLPGMPLIALIFWILAGIAFIIGIVFSILGFRKKRDRSSNPFSDIGTQGILIALLFAFIALRFMLSFQHGLMLEQLRHLDENLNEGFRDMSKQLDEILKRLDKIHDLLR